MFHALLLYTELGAECGQQLAICVLLRLLQRCANNCRPATVAVYVTLLGSGHAMAKFFKSRVWDKDPRGKYPYLARLACLLKGLYVLPMFFSLFFFSS